jgi:hypothetical protein
LKVVDEGFLEREKRESSQVVQLGVREDGSAMGSRGKASHLGTTASRVS